MYVCNTVKGGCKKVKTCEGENCHDTLKKCKENCVPLYESAIAEKKCKVEKYGKCTESDWCSCTTYGTEEGFKVPIWVWVVGAILLAVLVIIALLEAGSKKRREAGGVGDAGAFAAGIGFLG